MTEEELAAIEAQALAPIGPVLVTVRGDVRLDSADFETLAAIRAEVPRLVAEVRRLRAERDERVFMTQDEKMFWIDAVLGTDTGEESEP